MGFTRMRRVQAREEQRRGRSGSGAYTDVLVGVWLKPENTQSNQVGSGIACTWILKIPSKWDLASKLWAEFQLS